MARLIGIFLALFITTAHADEWRPIFGGSAASGLSARNELAFGTAESVSLTGSFAPGVQIIRAVCNADCYIAIGATGSTATIATQATGMHMPVNEIGYFRVSSGQTLAVIGPGGAGSIWVHEMSR